MKRLLISFFLFIPLLLLAQVPIMETEICRNFSFTDAQLEADRKCETLKRKYGYDNEIPQEVKAEIARLYKIMYPNWEDSENILNYSYDYSYDGPALWESQEYGCSWYCGASHFESVSSSLPSTSANNYSAESIHDDDVRTAWVEGVEGYGIGEYVDVHFPVQYSIRATKCYIVNGYNKNEKTWRNNSRVKSFNLYVDDKLIGMVNLKDTRDLQGFPLPQAIPSATDTTGFKFIPQYNEGNEHKKFSTLRLLITDVYKGDKYDDTAISELFFSGTGVHCIAEGAIVVMGNQSTKRIEQVKVDDTVLGYNEGVLGNKKVTAVHAVTHRTMYKISLKDGKTIIVTDDHPFLTVTGWKSLNPTKTKAYERYNNQIVNLLKEGDSVKVLHGENGTLSSEVIKIGDINTATKTYTLELEDESAFIANGIFVGQE